MFWRNPASGLSLPQSPPKKSVENDNYFFFWMQDFIRVLNSLEMGSSLSAPGSGVSALLKP